MPAVGSARRRFFVPSPLVIDASALVELLLQGRLAARIDGAIGERELIAPDILNPEVLQSLRGLERGGLLTAIRASQAVGRLLESRIPRIPTHALLRDAWALRHNVSAYDACYVVLARALDCPLLTTDSSLARAPQLGIALIVV
jgi:predicted nucleic acid-binding protein